MNRRNFLEAVAAVSAARAVTFAANPRPAPVNEIRQTSRGNRDLLTNGIIALDFDRDTGQFELKSPNFQNFGRLFSAGPALTLNGQRITARDTRHVSTRVEPFADEIGPGTKLICQYSFGGDRSLRYEINLYNGRAWASVTAYLPRGDFEIGEVEVLRGTVQALKAFNTRLYVCSGTAGGDTGVWQLGVRQWTSAALSVFYEEAVREALGVAFYSFSRASTTVVSQYLGEDAVEVSAIAHYHGYRPKDGELRSERLLLSFDSEPLRILEQWAQAAVDVVHPQFIHDTARGYLNTWYIFGNKTTQEQTIQQAKLLSESVLVKYGVRIVTTGEWQLQQPQFGDVGDALGFGQSQEDRGLYPQGLKWLVDQIRALGLDASFGGNYSYAALQSQIARENVPWIVKEDQSRLEYGFPIDFTHPDAQKWLYDIAHRTVEFGAVEWWSDFMGGPTRGALHDPTKILGFEDIREGLKVIRRAVGSQTMMEPACCGPYFTYIGLIDRDRPGNDVVALGNWQGLKDTARQLAATYMLHQRFWINNPDPLYVGGRDFVHNPGTGPLPFDAALLHEVRMRLQIQAISGSFVTIGENLEDLDAERIRLITLVLPSYGQAARPIDLFVNNTPEKYDLSIKTDWDRWHVLFLQNWNDERRTYDVRFSELELSEAKVYLVYDFWNQRFVGEFRNLVSLELNGREGNSFAIREAPEHPWVLSTDMHLTHGGVELTNVLYDSRTSQLSGVALRHKGAEGRVVLYAPKGYKARPGPNLLHSEQHSSGAQVVYLQLKFDSDRASWSVAFERG